MPSSKEATIREALKVIALAGDIAADRCELGLVERDIDTDIADDLNTNGPFVVVNPAEQTGFEFDPPASLIEVKIMVFFAFDADASCDFTEIEDVVFGFRDDIVDQASWAGSGAGAPISCTIRCLPVDVMKKPVCGKYEITLGFKICN